MQISVYEGDMLVGTAVLEHLDPPMGVAFGLFSPTDDYDRNTHANIVEGDYVRDRGRSLAAIIIEHDTPAAATIAIGDWSISNLGMELTLFFKDGENFAALFAAHPDYRAYLPAPQQRQLTAIMEVTWSSSQRRLGSGSTGSGL